MCVKYVVHSQLWTGSCLVQNIPLTTVVQIFLQKAFDTLNPVITSFRCRFHSPKKESVFHFHCCILLIPILVCLVCIRRTDLILHLEMIRSRSSRGPRTRADFSPKGIWHIKLSRNLCPLLLSFSPKGILSPLLPNAMSFRRQWGRTDQSCALANPPPPLSLPPPPLLPLLSNGD